MDNFQTLVATMEKDVRDLKTAHESKSSAKYFISQTIAVTDPPIGMKFKITYTNPGTSILTTIACDDVNSGSPTYGVIPFAPQNGVQFFILCDGLSGTWHFQFMSNQQIASVEVV